MSIDIVGDGNKLHGEAQTWGVLDVKCWWLDWLLVELELMLSPVNKFARACLHYDNFVKLYSIMFYLF